MLNNVEELKISLYKTKIDTKSIQAISESFEKNKNLKKIELNLNECYQIKSEGYLSLGKGLNMLSNVEEIKLNLTDSNIDN